MFKEVTHKDFLERLWDNNEHYRNGEFEVLGIYEKMKAKILIKDKYSEHLKLCERLLAGENVSPKTTTDTLEYYTNYIKYNCKHFDTDKYNITSVRKVGIYYNVIVDTPYGKCMMIPSNMLKGALPSIKSAVNKTEYFINQLKEKDLGIIDYSPIKYNKVTDKVTYITQYGYGEMLPASLLSCKRADGIESAKDKTEYIKAVLYNERGDKFDLSNVEYINNRTPIKIGCKEHGTFEVTPFNFISSKSHRGCPKCGREATTKSVIENPVGWSHENWHKAGKISKYFDNYKVYISELYNDNESFYKIGRTFLKTDRRFRAIRLSYDYKILHEFVSSDAKFICELENELKAANKHNKYVPNIIFEGMYECFSKVDDIDLIKDRLR